MFWGNDNGKYLIDCDTFVCKQKYFKCPGYYCIPWRVVCNGVWDCPGGTDETSICNYTACPRQFKCHNSSTCISDESVCDDILDCKQGDDEHFCYPPLPYCPEKCVCIIFSIYCFNSTYTEYENNVPFVHVAISNSAFDAFPTFLERFERVVFLTSWNTGMYSICSSLSTLSGKGILMLLDVANNYIRTLTSSCFKGMHRLRFLNFSVNNLRTIDQLTFTQIPLVTQIDLSHNSLENLYRNMFTGVKNLRVLQVENNSLLYVSALTFYDSSLDILVADNYKICCVKPSKKTVCNVEAKWPYSCEDRLLNSISLVIIMWNISITSLTLNTIAMVTTIIKMKKAERVVGYNYGLSVLGIVFSDFSGSISLFIILMADTAMGKDYFEFEYSWRGSLYCFISSFLSMTYCMMSGFMINFIAISRYSLVKWPFDSPFLNSFFVKICVISSVLIHLSGSLGLVLNFTYTSLNKRFPTGLCLLIGTKNTLWETYFTSGLMCVYTFSLPLIYILLHLARQKSSETLRDISTSTKGNKIQDIIIPLLNLLCWIISVTVLTITIIWQQYPYQMLVWANALVFPLNAIIDPFLFVISKGIKDIVSERK